MIKGHCFSKISQTLVTLGVAAMIMASGIALSQEDDAIEIPETPNYGLSGTWVWQEQNYSIESFDIVGIRPFAPVGGALSQALGTIHNEVDSYTMRLDSWLFPFLNVYGILGRAEGEVAIDLGAIPPLGQPAQTFTVGYDGLVYGGGVVAAAGWDRYFVSVDGSFTVTDLTGGGSIDTWVFSPRVGFHEGKLTAWVGATYQETSHQQTGSFLLFPFTIDYEVTLQDANNWNYTVGGRWDFNDTWSMTAEGGFGDRRQALVTIGHRF